jgi:hypothetical protein
MEQFLEIIVALLCLGAVHFGFTALAKMGARRVGRTIGSTARPGLRRVLTVYYRGKVIRQMQEARKKQGAPPLENPYLD